MLEIILMKLENNKTYCRLSEVTYLIKVILFKKNWRGYLNAIFGADAYTCPAAIVDFPKSVLFL